MVRDHRSRLDDYLAANDLEAVWFARPNSFAWLTGGDNVVSEHADVGVAAAGYDGDGVTVVTNDIEADRLREEELGAEVSVEAYPWHETSLAAAVADRTPTPAAADFDVPELDRVDASPLRQPLTKADAERYRSLAADAAAAVETVCESATPGMTERETAARLHEQLARDGIAAPVALVGGGERAPRYRHYTPKNVELGDYALVSVGATRGGLYASVTRTVAFDPPSWLDDRTEAAARVEATALAATREAAREGGTAGDVFAAIRDAYEAVGFPDEWTRHHQGGAAGYAGREWKATPDSAAPVTAPMAYAWNPTIQGAKSENTWLVTDGGFECLTAGERTTRAVDAVGYDVTLERAAIVRPE